MGYYEDNNSFITGNTSEKTAKFLKDIFGKETTPVSDCDPFENCTTLIDGFISGLCIDDLDEVDVALYDATWLLFPETQMVFCHFELQSVSDWYYSSKNTYDRNENLLTIEKSEIAEGLGIFEYIKAGYSIDLTCPHCGAYSSFDKVELVSQDGIDSCDSCIKDALYRWCPECEKAVGFKYDDNAEPDEEFNAYTCPECGTETEELEPENLDVELSTERSETSEEQLPPIRLDKELLFRILSWAKENLDQQELASATERIQALME